MPHPADVEAGLQQSHGYVSPFMVTSPTVYAVAFHDFEDKTLAECKGEQDKLKGVMRKVIEQGVGDDGMLDLEKVDVFAGNATEKGEKLMELHSRMGGINSALRPKLEKERAAEAVRLGIIDANIGGGRGDGTGRVIRVKPSDRILAALEEDGLSYKTVANKGGTQVISVDWDTATMDGQEFLAAVFETDHWQPDIQREPGWVPFRGPGNKPLQVTDIIPVMMTEKDAVTWMEETTHTNSAAVTAEGAAAPESDFALTERKESIQRISHFLPVTEESLDDEPQLRGYLDYVMPTGVRQKLDQAIISGTGAVTEISGILAYNVAGLSPRSSGLIQLLKYTSAASSVTGLVGSIVKPWNVLLKAAYEIEDHGMGILGMQSPSHAILHPRLYLQCLLSESSSGGYYVGGPQSMMLDLAWGMRVVKTTHLSNSVSADTTAHHNHGGIIGDFSPLFITLYMRHEVRTEIGYISDDFQKYKRSIRSSVRGALAMRRAAAFVGLINPKANGEVPTT